jgi:hypothetical protein
MEIHHDPLPSSLEATDTLLKLAIECCQEHGEIVDPPSNRFVKSPPHPPWQFKASSNHPLGLVE